MIMRNRARLGAFTAVALAVCAFAATLPLQAEDGPTPDEWPTHIANPGQLFSSGAPAAQPALRAPGWESPVNVSVSPGASGAPTIDVDSRGVVHLAWYDNSPGNWEILYAARLPASSTWVSRENVSSNGSFSLVPSLAVDHSDNVNVAWQDYGGPTRLVWQGTLLYKQQQPGDVFAAPEAISATSGFGGYPAVRDPHLTVDSADNLRLVWSGHTASGYRILYARRSDTLPVPTWTRPQVINPGAGTCFNPRAAVDAADRLHVVWQEIIAGAIYADIYYTAQLASGAWAPPVNISRNSGQSIDPWLTIGRDGTLHVVWRDFTQDEAQGEVYYARKPLAGEWTTPANLSQTAGDSSGPVLAEDAYGVVHLVWYDNNPGNWDILYVTKPPAGIWTTASNLSETPGRSGQPTMVFDPRGILHVAWADDTPGDFDAYYTSKAIPAFSASHKQATARVLPGEEIAYVVTIRNDSTAALTVHVTDTVPLSTTLVGGSGHSAGGVVTEAGDTVYWTGSVPAGGQVQVRLRALLDGGVAAGTVIRNQAALSNSSGATVLVEATTRVMLARVNIPIVVQAY